MRVCLAFIVKTMIIYSLLLRVAFAEVSSSDASQTNSNNVLSLQSDYDRVNIGSVFVLKRDEIRRAGATSLMEAMRLVPGLFVAEQRNGYYNVTVRGLNNLPTTDLAYQSVSKRVALLIDGRQVREVSFGTTPWYSLPIGIEDIESIKIYRGANSVEFGSGAVAGVVEISTRSNGEPDDSRDIFFEAEAYQGTSSTERLWANLDYVPEDEDWSIGVSVYQEQRDRHQETLYSQLTQDYQDFNGSFEADIAIANEPFDPTLFFSDASRAMDRKGINISIEYDDGVNERLRIGAGLVTDQFMRVGYWGYGTPFTEFDYRSSNLNIRYDYDDFSFHLFRNNQESKISDDINFMAGERFNESSTGLRIGYQLKISQFHSMRFAYLSHYAALDTDNSSTREGKGVQDNAFLIEDIWTVSDRMMLLLSARVDSLGSTRETKLPVKVGAKYRIADHMTMRVLFSQAYEVPRYTSYLWNEEVTLESGVVYSNDKNAGMETHENEMVEIGFSGNFSHHTFYDVEFWYQQSKGYFSRTILVQTPTFIETYFLDLPTKAEQYGMTFNIEHQFLQRQDELSLRYYFTVQKSKQFDFYQDPFLRIGFTEEYELNTTPKWFGGVVFNYRVTNRMNLNLNGYVTDDSQIQIAFYEPDDIEGIRIVNAKFSYDFTDRLSVYVNGRNVLDSDKAEFFNTDFSRDMLLFGFSLR